MSGKGEPQGSGPADAGIRPPPERIVRWWDGLFLEHWDYREKRVVRVEYVRADMARKDP